MLDADTFLTELYVMVDDFCKANLPADTRPGPEASLSRSEVVTLAIFGQWGRFASERDRQRSRSWPSASSPCATVPIPACQAWAATRLSTTWPTRVLPAENCMRVGSKTTGRTCSRWCHAGIESSCPSGGTSAWSASVRLSKRFTRSFVMLSGSSESGLTSWAVSPPGLPLRWACTTSAFGSIVHWDAHHCSSQTCWTGKMIHTKRFSLGERDLLRTEQRPPGNLTPLPPLRALPDPVGTRQGLRGTRRGGAQTTGGEH